MADTIITYTGILMVPTDPKPENFEIRDIAHSLSLICRGNGQVVHFFSVGQHCIRCAREAMARGYSDRVAMAALLHDAGEGYLSDVPRPFKKELPGYRVWEDRILTMIYGKYLGSDLTPEETALVKQVDDDLLFFDLRDLLRRDPQMEEPEMKISVCLDVEPFEVVEQEYLQLFEILNSRLHKQD